MVEKLKSLQPYLKGPYGGLFLILLAGWMISKLPPEQFAQLQTFWDQFNSPLGWAILCLVFLVSVVNPIFCKLQDGFSQYLEKEKAHVRTLEEFKDQTALVAERLETLLTQKAEEFYTLNERLKNIEHGVSGLLTDMTELTRKLKT